MAGPVVVVAGALANKPDNGGEAWVRFSWIRGLERLGCRVFFVEEMDEAVCTDAERRPAPFARTGGIVYSLLRKIRGLPWRDNSLRPSPSPSCTSRSPPVTSCAAPSPLRN